MTTRKTVNKQSEKVKLNHEFNLSSKTGKKVKKSLKKANKVAVLVAVICLLIGAIGGFFTTKILTKNDCFELIGSDQIVLTVGESYLDQGVKVVSFGKDFKDKVEIETDLTKDENGLYSAQEVGSYYIIYKVNNLKYGSIFKIQKIRIISYIEASEAEEIEGALW